MPEAAAAAAAAPAESSPDRAKNKKENNKKKATDDKKSSSKQPPREYNPLWKGYLYIVLASLINLSSLSNAREDDFTRGNYKVGLMFGIVTFTFCLLVLILDRTKWFTGSSGNKCDYAKAMDGKIEGYTLLILIIWWIVGVAYITQADGLAYVANNIYFSSWMSLAACIYTLNKWSTKRDLLSLNELTGISETLKSWYILFLSSLVVMGTCIDLIAQVWGSFVDDAAFGLSAGFISAALSLFWILVHYNFVTVVHEGGWLELCSSFFAILIWIAGTAVLTRQGGLGATIVGSGCYVTEFDDGVMRDDIYNCSIVYYYYEPITRPPFPRTDTTYDGGNATNETVTSTLNETLDELNGTLISPYPNSSVLWSLGGQATPAPRTGGLDDDYIDPTDIPRNLTLGTLPCDEAESRNIPGSNLYLAVWACMGASINITLRWKAQQAMQFAQAAQNKQRLDGDNKKTDGQPNATGLQALDADAGDDDDDDLDDFVDAYE